MKEGVDKNMMNILIGAGIIALAIELFHQRSLMKYYKQMFKTMEDYLVLFVLKLKKLLLLKVLLNLIVTKLLSLITLTMLLKPLP